MSSYFDRRSILFGCGALGLVSACARPSFQNAAPGPGIAVTIDDFDLSDTILMTGARRDAAILAALDHHSLKAGGFVAGKYIVTPLGPQVLGQWSDKGHLIGNHSFSHQYFSGEAPEKFMADILQCEGLLSTYPGFQKLFRFPYLAEGKTSGGRNAMRDLLKDHGYRNAHVTIDTSDWYIDNRLKARLKSDPGADLTPYRQYYLDHIWDRATYYDGLAQSMFGHSISHTILLHHRLTTALFLGNMLSMFRARGWRLVDAATAFASPEFALEPETLPAGQSLIWSAAKADGRFDNLMRFPGEDGEYEKPKMDALGL